MDADQESKDKKRTQYKSYGSSAMEKAMAAVQNEGKTMYRASKDFGVPMNTLRDRLIGKGFLKPKSTVLHDEGKVPAKQPRQTKEGAKPAHFTVEDDILERWQNIGKSEGLTSTAAIIEFLVSLYYNTGKQEEHKKDIRCQECQNPLTLFCAHCQLVPPPALSRYTSAPKRAAHNLKTSLFVSHIGTAAPLPQRDPAEHTVAHIKTEQNSVTVSPKTRTRMKRLMQSCENNKTLMEVEASQGESKTFREVEVSSDDSQSVLGEDNVAVELLPEMQKDSSGNGEFKDNGNDPVYSLDDFLEDLQEETDKKSKKRTVECPECGESFEDSAGLQRHLVTTLHNPEHVCNLCHKSFKHKSAFLQHQRVHSRQEQQCPICGLSFRFPSRLNKHLKTHGTDRPHVCDKCGKSFISVYYLRDHIKIHSEERGYKCELCGATFKQKPALYAHGKKHSNAKPFQCQYCGLKYRDSQKMKIHVRTHTGEKPYQCPMCDARFVSNSNMWQHCAYVHGKSTKTHQCPHCPLTFAAKGKLKIHLKNAHHAGTDGGGTESGGSSCQFEVMRGQPFYIQLPGGSPSDTSLTSVGTLCHVSMSL